MAIELNFSHKNKGKRVTLESCFTYLVTMEDTQDSDALVMDIIKMDSDRSMDVGPSGLCSSQVDANGHLVNQVSSEFESEIFDGIKMYMAFRQDLPDWVFKKLAEKDLYKAFC